MAASFYPLRLLYFWAHEAVHVLLQQLFVCSSCLPLLLVDLSPPTYFATGSHCFNEPGKNTALSFSKRRTGVSWRFRIQENDMPGQPKLCTKKFPKRRIAGVCIKKESCQHPQIYRKVIHGALYQTVLRLYSNVHHMPLFTIVCNFTKLKQI